MHSCWLKLIIPQPAGFCLVLFHLVNSFSATLNYSMSSLGSKIAFWVRNTGLDSSLSPVVINCMVLSSSFCFKAQFPIWKIRLLCGISELSTCPLHDACSVNVCDYLTWKELCQVTCKHSSHLLLHAFLCHSKKKVCCKMLRTEESTKLFFKEMKTSIKN
jgi:hypothetical protein